MATTPTPAAERRALREQFESELAQTLRDRGLVDSRGLEDAIRQQVLMGGHLATNLWELGLVEGRILSRLSAELLDLPEAMPKSLAKISPANLALLPYDVAERTRVLPMSVARSVLCVATCEPWDHLALGEAARVSGYPLQLHFVAEVPLVRLLRRHYGIPLRSRFLLSRPTLKATSKLRREKGEEAAFWDDLPELPGEIATVIASGVNATADTEPTPSPLVGLGAARKELAAAEDRDAVAMVLLRFALSRGTRAVLFTHRAGQWSGWLATGDEIDSERVRRLVMPATPGTVFGLVSKTGAHFLGPLAEHPQHTEFLQVLGQGVPGAVAFLPVHFRGKLSCGLYIDAGDGADVATDIADVLVLAQAVPATLERLISARLAASRALSV